MIQMVAKQKKGSMKTNKTLGVDDCCITDEHFLVFHISCIIMYMYNHVSVKRPTMGKVLNLILWCRGSMLQPFLLTFT